MKCPKCGERSHVEIGLVEGYAQDSRECADCGLVWTFSGNNLVIIFTPKNSL